MPPGLQNREAERFVISRSPVVMTASSLTSFARAGAKDERPPAGTVPASQASASTTAASRAVPTVGQDQAVEDDYDEDAEYSDYDESAPYLRVSWQTSCFAWQWHKTGVGVWTEMVCLLCMPG